MPKLPKSNKAKKLNHFFDLRLKSGRRQSFMLQREFKTIHASTGELEYWCLFVTAHYTTGSRRTHFVRSYNIDGKIADMKKSGTWPPIPTNNQNMMPLFLKAHPEFVGLLPDNLPANCY